MRESGLLPRIAARRRSRTGRTTRTYAQDFPPGLSSLPENKARDWPSLRAAAGSRCFSFFFLSARAEGRGSASGPGPRNPHGDRGRGGSRRMSKSFSSPLLRGVRRSTRERERRKLDRTRHDGARTGFYVIPLINRASRRPVRCP